MRIQLGPPSYGYTTYVEYKHGQFVLTEEDTFALHKQTVIPLTREEAEKLVIELTQLIEDTK